jgi:PEP-CTERM motif
MRPLVAAFVLMAALFTPRPAAAVPYTITLENAVFADGGMWDGYFSWNGNSTFDWFLHSSGGNTSLFPEVTITPENSQFGAANETLVLLQMPASPLYRAFVWKFSDSHLDGSANFLTETGFGARECFNCNPSRMAVSGGVTASGDVENFQSFGQPPTGVPEPSTAILFGLSMLGLAARHRFRPENPRGFRL